MEADRWGVRNLVGCGRGSWERVDRVVEVLVSRKTILGNPFNMHGRERFRHRCVEAYEDFLEAAMMGKDEVDLEAIADEWGLPVEIPT